MNPAQELIQKINDVTGERDDARTQFAEASAEAERLREDNDSLRRAYNTLAKACDESMPRVKERIASLEQKLVQAECDKAALVEGIAVYRELCRLGSSLRAPYVKEWELNHGALVPPKGTAPSMLRRFETIIGNTYDERDEWGEHEAIDEVAVAVKEYYEPDCDSLVVWVREIGSDAPPRRWLVSATREHEARPADPAPDRDPSCPRARAYGVPRGTQGRAPAAWSAVAVARGALSFSGSERFRSR